MKVTRFVLVAATILLFLSKNANACTPYGTPQVAYNIVGTDLNVTVTSTTGWSCCYVYELELICDQANFSGTAQYQPNFNLCKSSSANASYQVYTIDISTLCPGQTYKFRVREKVETYNGWFSASPYSAVQTFVVPGPQLDVTAAGNPLQICPPQCTDISAVAVNNCAPVNYTWDQGVGAGANHNVCPTGNTTYTVTATMNIPFCPIPATATDQVTITSAPLAEPGVASLAPTPICEGESTNLTLVGYTGNIQWQSSSTSGGPWSDVPGATTDNYNTGALTTSTFYQAKVYTCDTVYSNEVFVEVFPNPIADFTAGDVCFNEQVSFNDQSNAPGSSINNWLWDFGDGNTSVQQSPSHTYGADGTYTVNLTVENNVGCSDDVNFDVTVYPLPVASFDFDEVCEDENTTLANTSVVAAPSTLGNSFWDIGEDGFVDYTTQDASHAFGSFGNYTVELVIESDFGCADSIAQSFNVWPLPVVDFDANPLCFGDVTDFTDQTTVPFGGNVVDWAWDFGDGNTENIQNPSNEYTTPGVYDIELVATTDQGCTDNLIEPVDIFALPTADFTVDNECFYDALNFNDQSSTSVDQWEWDFGDGNTSNQQNPSHQYASAGTYTVELIVNTASGCADTTELDVTAYAQPSAEFSINPVCLNNNSVFTDLSDITPVDGDNITNWQWDFDNGSTSTQQNPSNAYAAEGIFNVSLTVTTNFGCVDVFTTDAVVWPLPSVDFTPVDVCLDFSTEFSDQSTISNAFTNNNLVDWEWDFGDGNGSNVQNPTHTYDNEGNYDANLIVTSGNGCVNDETIQVTVHPKPVASFAGVNLSGCAPICPEITSTSVVSGSSTIVNYEWTLSDGTTADGPSAVFSDCFDNQSGNSIFYGVELEVTTSEGCTNTYTEPNYIEVFHNPIANFFYAPDAPDVLNPEVSFTNTSSFADSYSWSFSGIGSSNDVNPVIEFPTEPESYDVELVANTDEGCTDTIRGVVEILDRVIFYVPNTFTPDSDNFNETFQPVFFSGYDPFDYNLLIFDRWGEIVFESNDASIGWDGTYGAESSRIVRDGTYVWKIEFKETMTDKRRTHTGHVNVLK